MTGGENFFKYKQCIVLRTDLDMSCGKLCAQAAHASIEAYINAPEPDRTIWFKEGQKKVILKASNEQTLHDVKTKAESMGIPVSLIIDMGFTEISPNTITAVGIGPAKVEIVNKVTGNLGLYKLPN